MLSKHPHDCAGCAYGSLYEAARWFLWGFWQ
jgi:hypothetical protein